MPVSDFQRQVATLALSAAARHGFVLGGGNALILHGIVDRYTADVVMRSVKLSKRRLSHDDCPT
jgi:hypothetical protein